MSEWANLGTVDAVPDGTSEVFSINDREVAVFNVDGELYAIDNRCPHQQAALQTGTTAGTVVTCPWHKWKFDLITGRCTSHPGSFLTRFEVRTEGSQILVDLESIPEESASDGIHRYLVRYGSMGRVECFGCLDEVPFEHRSPVVVHSSRGIEVGELLAISGPNAPDLQTQRPTGELLRRLTPEDEARRRQRRHVAPQILQDCEEILRRHECPADIVDSELLFDGATAVLYYLGDVELSPAITSDLQTIGNNADLVIKLEPLIEPEVAPASTGGCGSGQCGSGGGGCHS